MHHFDYGPTHRELQRRHDTEALAQALLQVIVHDELTDTDQAFIASRDMFWLATVDAQGQPTVSFKGGPPSFVRAVDSRTLAFPCYDGNGMYYSMGNVAATSRVGLLFMDFERPHRLRVQGRAELTDDEGLLAGWPGAQFGVRVHIDAIFQNCPRYVPRMRRVADSRYVPAADGSAPVPGWKRIDAIQPVLPARDAGCAERGGGLISAEQYAQMVMTGHPEA